MYLWPFSDALIIIPYGGKKGKRKRRHKKTDGLFPAVLTKNRSFS
jgi:hypothetical protein